MEQELYSLSKIFSDAIYRIPDYQRGYAWGKRQLIDFWEDLQRLENGKPHYTGFLTIEPVPRERYTHWEDDLWIISSKYYKPYYIVDGQQRLTTAMILIQVILENIPDGQKINFNETKEDIRKKYIYESKDGGISRSYLFGYEKDNPSYQYLKCHIFQDKEENDGPEVRTLYTNNLQSAKEFFSEQIKSLSQDEMGDLYIKLVKGLRFNIHLVKEDIDVNVTFETMNNRGKPLSHLEILKNRLIYLSLSSRSNSFDGIRLRRLINEAWMMIYRNLGRNPKSKVDDDDFLYAHFNIHFGKNSNLPEEYIYYGNTIRLRDSYKEYLLNEVFSIKKISAMTPEDAEKLISDYVLSLKKYVPAWFDALNPEVSQHNSVIKDLLINLNRLGFNLSIVMTVLANSESEKTIERFLASYERLKFLDSLTYYEFSSTEKLDLSKVAIKYSHGEIKTDNVIEIIENFISSQVNSKEFQNAVIKHFNNRTFYGWDKLRFFLYEYECVLKNRSKTHRDKINDEDFFASRNHENYADYKTIEHIYPQRPSKGSWDDISKNYNDKERKALRHSLGNLLPLAKRKNSSLGNASFKEKCGSKATQVGYRYGSHSEMEIADLTDWTPLEILNRGLRLLSFAEERWTIRLGDINRKVDILGLGFLKDKYKFDKSLNRFIEK